MKNIIIFMGVAVCFACASSAYYVRTPSRTLPFFNFHCIRQFVPVSRCRTEDIALYTRIHAELSRGHVDRAVQVAREWLMRQFSSSEQTQDQPNGQRRRSQLKPEANTERSLQTSSSESRQRRCERVQQTYIECCNTNATRKQQCDRADAFLDERESRLQNRFEDLDSSIRERYERAYDAMFEAFERDWQQNRQAGL